MAILGAALAFFIAADRVTASSIAAVEAMPSGIRQNSGVHERRRYDRRIRPTHDYLSSAEPPTLTLAEFLMLAAPILAL